MAHKLRYWCVTAYNKKDLLEAQQRGLQKGIERTVRGMAFEGESGVNKRFRGQHEEHFMDKPSAITRKEELEKKYDVVRLRKCKI